MKSPPAKPPVSPESVTPVRVSTLPSPERGNREDKTPLSEEGGEMASPLVQSLPASSLHGFPMPPARREVSTPVASLRPSPAPQEPSSPQGGVQEVVPFVASRASGDESALIDSFRRAASSPPREASPVLRNGPVGQYDGEELVVASPSNRGGSTPVASPRRSLAPQGSSLPRDGVEEVDPFVASRASEGSSASADSLQPAEPSAPRASSSSLLGQRDSGGLPIVSSPNGEGRSSASRSPSHVPQDDVGGDGPFNMPSASREESTPVASHRSPVAPQGSSSPQGGVGEVAPFVASGASEDRSASVDSLRGAAPSPPRVASPLLQNGLVGPHDSEELVVASPSNRGGSNPVASPRPSLAPQGPSSPRDGVGEFAPFVAFRASEDRSSSVNSLQRTAPSPPRVASPLLQNGLVGPHDSEELVVASPSNREGSTPVASPRRSLAPQSSSSPRDGVGEIAPPVESRASEGRSSSIDSLQRAASSPSREASPVLWNGPVGQYDGEELVVASPSNRGGSTPVASHRSPLAPQSSSSPQSGVGEVAPPVASRASEGRGSSIDSLQRAASSPPREASPVLRNGLVGPHDSEELVVASPSNREGSTPVASPRRSLAPQSSSSPQGGVGEIAPPVESRASEGRSSSIDSLQRAAASPPRVASLLLQNGPVGQYDGEELVVASPSNRGGRSSASRSPPPRLQGDAAEVVPCATAGHTSIGSPRSEPASRSSSTLPQSSAEGGVLSATFQTRVDEGTSMDSARRAGTLPSPRQNGAGGVMSTATSPLCVNEGTSMDSARRAGTLPSPRQNGAGRGMSTATSPQGGADGMGPSAALPVSGDGDTSRSSSRQTSIPPLAFSLLSGGAQGVDHHVTGEGEPHFCRKEGIPVDSPRTAFSPRSLSASGADRVVPSASSQPDQVPEVLSASHRGGEESALGEARLGEVSSLVYSILDRDLGREEVEGERSGTEADGLSQGRSQPELDNAPKASAVSESLPQNGSIEQQEPPVVSCPALFLQDIGTRPRIDSPRRGRVPAERVLPSELRSARLLPCTWNSIPGQRERGRSLERSDKHRPVGSKGSLRERNVKNIREWSAPAPSRQRQWSHEPESGNRTRRPQFGREAGPGSLAPGQSSRGAALSSPQRGALERFSPPHVATEGSSPCLSTPSESSPQTSRVPLGLSGSPQAVGIDLSKMGSDDSTRGGCSEAPLTSRPSEARPALSRRELVDSLRVENSSDDEGSSSRSIPRARLLNLRELSERGASSPGNDAPSPRPTPPAPPPVSARQSTRVSLIEGLSKKPPVVPSHRPKVPAVASGLSKKPPVVPSHRPKVPAVASGLSKKPPVVPSHRPKVPAVANGLSEQPPVEPSHRPKVPFVAQETSKRPPPPKVFPSKRWPLTQGANERRPVVPKSRPFTVSISASGPTRGDSPPPRVDPSHPFECVSPQQGASSSSGGRFNRGVSMGPPFVVPCSVERTEPSATPSRGRYSRVDSRYSDAVDPLTVGHRVNIIRNEFHMGGVRYKLISPIPHQVVVLYCREGQLVGVTDIQNKPVEYEEIAQPAWR
jgi:hypothetical protein